MKRRSSFYRLTRVVTRSEALTPRSSVTVSSNTGVLVWPLLKMVQLPATADHHSSMLQDIRQGRETEIYSLNGAVVRLGEKHGITTLANRTLIELIRFKTSQNCQQTD